MPTPANPLAKETTTMTNPDQPKKAEPDLLERLGTYRRTRTERGASLGELALLEEVREALGELVRVRQAIGVYATHVHACLGIDDDKMLATFQRALAPQEAQP